MVDG
jgi:hypothetical protein